MENFHEEYFRNHRFGYSKEVDFSKEEENEINRKIDRGIKIFFGSLIFLTVLVLSNGIFTKSVPLEGVVMSSEFLKGEWVGPPSAIYDGPSLMSPLTYFRPDSYEIIVSIGSGESVAVLCYKCKADSFKAGDPIEIVRVERFVGSPKYEERAN